MLYSSHTTVNTPQGGLIKEFLCPINNNVNNISQEVFNCFDGFYRMKVNKKIHLWILTFEAEARLNNI
jgi:hypothetical protein